MTMNKAANIVWVAWVLIMASMLMGFSWPSSPWKQGTEIQQIVWSARVERACACAGDTQTSNKWWKFGRWNLITAKSEIQDMLYDGYWVDTNQASSGTFDGWFSSDTNHTDFPRLVYYAVTNAGYRTNILDVCGMDTNFWNDTPFKGLSTHSNGWPGLKKVLEQMVWTATNSITWGSGGLTNKCVSYFDEWISSNWAEAVTFAVDSFTNLAENTAVPYKYTHGTYWDIDEGWRAIICTHYSIASNVFCDEFTGSAALYVKAEAGRNQMGTSSYWNANGDGFTTNYKEYATAIVTGYSAFVVGDTSLSAGVMCREPTTNDCDCSPSGDGAFGCVEEGYSVRMLYHLLLKWDVTGGFDYL